MPAMSSAGSDTSSVLSSSPEPDNQQKQTLKAGSKAKDDVESSSSSGSSDSESDSSASEMDTSEDVAETRPRGKKIPVAQPYKPPSGFKSGKTQAPPSSSSSSILSNLAGKQIIHITAPSFLPLSKVKEISMSKILKGEPILSFDGSSYGIPAESFDTKHPQGKSLLIYDQKSQSYQSQADHIQTYHIQEMAGRPEADYAAIEALRDTVKPPRPQPRHLKMRFRPVGSLPAPPETLGSDSEEEPSRKVAGGKEERKRKHHQSDADAVHTTTLPSRKKTKKHAHDNEAEDGSNKKKSKTSHKDREEKKRKKSSKE